MKIFCAKLAMVSWHSVHNALDVNTAYNNFIKINDNLLSKCCQITIKKSEKFFGT